MRPRPLLLLTGVLAVDRRTATCCRRSPAAQGRVRPLRHPAGTPLAIGLLSDAFGLCAALRLAGWLFGLHCVGGAAAALGLTVHEARRDAPVQAKVVTSTREGLTTVAEVDLRNFSRAARCVLVRVVSRRTARVGTSQRATHRAGTRTSLPKGSRT